MAGKTTKKNDIKVEETQKVENTIVEEKAPKATEEDNTAKETAKEKAPKTEKTTAKKTTKKKASTKSTEAKNASTTAKKTTQKTTTKKVPQNVYFEVYGMQTKIMVEDYEKRIKDIWLNSWNRLVKDLKEIDMYIKPEESKVYFVINGTEHGSIDM